MMLGDAARHTVPALRLFGLVVQQMSAIGVGSLGLVFVVSLFTGAAAVQAAYQFSTMVPPVPRGDHPPGDHRARPGAHRARGGWRVGARSPPSSAP
jgi:hypothetical protein